MATSSYDLLPLQLRHKIDGEKKKSINFFAKS